MVRRQIDQMIRTRTFKVRNERIGTRVLVKSQKGRNVSVDRRQGECYQWKAKGHSAKGDACSFRHDYSKRGKKTPSSSLAPRSQAKNDGSRPSKGKSVPGAFVPQEGSIKNRAEITLMDTARIRCVIIGILTVCQNYKSDSDVNSATSVCSDILRFTDSPVNS